MAVQVQLTIYHPRLAHTKGVLLIIGTNTQGQTENVWMELVPQAIIVHHQRIVLHVASTHLALIHKNLSGINALTLNHRLHIVKAEIGRLTA